MTDNDPAPNPDGSEDEATAGEAASSDPRRAIPDDRLSDEPPEWAKRQARELAAANADVDEAVTGDATVDDVPVVDPTDEHDRDDREDDRVPDVPVEAVEEAERLTRLAREAIDEEAARAYRTRRDRLADEHDYTTRLREDDDTLVLYPEEWVDDGTVQFDRIEDTDRAVEASLSGPGDPDRFREIAAYNDAVVGAVEAAAPADTTETHVATARSLAAFAGNHYVCRLDELTPDMRAEFREEYFPRNGWPTDEQRALLSASIELVERVAADVDDPTG